MDRNQTEIKLDVDSWDIKLLERKRERMKLHIKLSKDEAVAYKNFASVCKPEDVTDADFLKTVFITGIGALNEQLKDLVAKYAVENKEDLESSGITVIEDDEGGVKFAPSEMYDVSSSDTSDEA